MSSQHSSPNSDVVILTALRIEHQAVLTHLQNIEEVIDPYGTIYQRGTFFGEEYKWDVAVAEIGMAGTVAAIGTERAINFFRPAIVFL